MELRRRRLRATNDPSDRYSNWPPPDPLKGPIPLDRPSVSKALVWTLLAAFWLWLLLPVAVYYTRRAPREAKDSTGRYRWSNNVLHRPVLLRLVVLECEMVLIFAMAATGLYGDP